MSQNNQQDQDKVNEIGSIRNNRSKRLEQQRQELHQQILSRRADIQRAQKIDKTQDGQEIITINGVKPYSWFEDHVEFSKKAELFLMESRATNPILMTDVGYRNKNKVVELRGDLRIAVVPSTGTYRAVYNDSFLVPALK